MTRIEFYIGTLQKRLDEGTELGNKFGNELLLDLCLWVRELSDLVGTNHAAMSQARLDRMTMVPREGEKKELFSPATMAEINIEAITEADRLKKLNESLNDQNVRLAMTLTEYKELWSGLIEKLEKTSNKWNQIVKGNAYLEALQDTLKWMREVTPE